MAEILQHPDGSTEIRMRDPLFTDGTSTELIVSPGGDAELFLECGNCAGTAGARITYTDLAELRDLLTDMLKDRA